MPPTSTARLLSPEEIAIQAGHQVAFLRLPERASVFAERAMRLRQRAAGHPMRDFLLFIAEVADAQHALLSGFPAVQLSGEQAIESAARRGVPPLAASTWPRDPAWRTGLRQLLDALMPRLADSPALATVQLLREAGDDWIEQQAGRLLGGVMMDLDLAAAPLIAAALQAYWTHLVISTDAARGAGMPNAFGRIDDPTVCPCCGSRPTASISRIGAEASGYRYLHCALCSTQWHMVRIKCSHCLSTKGIHYQSLAQRDAVPDDDAAPGAQPVVEAETCDSCGHYLKIVHMERDHNVEPVADDLATLTLDLLVSEAGFERHGVQMLLLFGDSDPPQGGGGGSG
ncbi:formate dehydrogenase accessory protein FdhE [Variovorax sp. Sphag1AA]|uniref:formate dehydrogenase accessory protein FdhE n=1 Tax=Variovorax sp. Sphag1AA TaxID=2587027 RepID=UPI00161255D8|nr:formate dehydrogenase accessory protein FdhE [Variovorax sp. Sphag1AA]MBB3181389.1 FdhE protein [Variovorax sp. Sphag1AA]